MNQDLGEPRRAQAQTLNGSFPVFIPDSDNHEPDAGN